MTTQTGVYRFYVYLASILLKQSFETFLLLGVLRKFIWLLILLINFQTNSFLIVSFVIFYKKCIFTSYFIISLHLMNSYVFITTQKQLQEKSAIY